MDRDLSKVGERTGTVAGDVALTSEITTVGSAGFTASWLALREPADAAARAAELLVPLREHLPATGRLVIRDLGCGTGALGRWLSARLPQPQHWILQDRDPDLLARADLGSRTSDPSPDLAAHVVAGQTEASRPEPPAPGRLTWETRRGDVTGLRAEDLADTSLVVASALLDLLTAEEVDQLARACVSAGCPALWSLSVTGQVELDPSEPLDADIAAAFNAHQRRVTGGRRLLGPDAVTAATEAFERYGARVLSQPSPWRLDGGQAALTREWLRGWVGAAEAQRPELRPETVDYLRRREAACAAGTLRVVVHHIDLLTLPPQGRR